LVSLLYFKQIVHIFISFESIYYKFNFNYKFLTKTCGGIPMKTKNIVIVAGVSFLHLIILGGVALTSGCTTTEVLAPKGYIPAPAEQLPSEAPELKLEIEPIAQPEKIEIEETIAPATTPIAPQTITLEPVKTEIIKYKVTRGDSFWLISKKYGVSQQELAAYNKMNLKQTLKVGQMLNIPPGGKLKSPAELKASLKKARKARKVSKKRRHHRSVKTKVITHQPIPSSGTYTVKPGDNPWTIARKFRVNTNRLLGANGLNRSSVLKIGQKLVIPGGTSNTHAVAATSRPSVKPVKTIEPTPSTIEDANKTTNDILNSVDEPSSEAPAKVTTTTTTEDLSEADDTFSDDETSISGADTVTLDADTTIDKFAAAYKVKVEDLERLNPDLPKDGNLKSGALILMPAK
jgi:LysM repeat protein